MLGNFIYWIFSVPPSPTHSLPLPSPRRIRISASSYVFFKIIHSNFPFFFKKKIENTFICFFCCKVKFCLKMKGMMKWRSPPACVSPFVSFVVTCILRGNYRFRTGRKGRRTSDGENQKIGHKSESWKMKMCSFAKTRQETLCSGAEFHTRNIKGKHRKEDYIEMRIEHFYGTLYSVPIIIQQWEITR